MYDLQVIKEGTKKDKNMVIFMSEPKFLSYQIITNILLRFMYICPKEGGSGFQRKSVCLFQTKLCGNLDTLHPSLLDLQDSKSVSHYMTGFGTKKFRNQTGLTFGHRSFTFNTNKSPT
jgi:hypothetical protein